jgi:hypothetical protein
MPEMERQGVGRMQRAIEDVDALIQLRYRIEKTTALVDLVAHLELQLGEVDGIAMQRQRLACGRPQTINQLVDERPGVRVIARCIRPDEAGQRRSTDAEDGLWIQEVAEKCQG